jgi:glutaredoxin
LVFAGALTVGYGLGREPRPLTERLTQPAAAEAPAQPASVETSPAHVPLAEDRPAPAAKDRRPAAAPAYSLADLEAAMRRVPVTMYMTTWCPVCTKARAWFNENRCTVIERDVDADPVFKQGMHRLNPRHSVPTIEIDGQVLVGFSPRDLARSLAAAAKRRMGWR